MAAVLPLLLACVPPPPERVAGESALDFIGPPPANVLMISIDTLRRDRVGRYSGLTTTPFLDSLLAEGVAFDDHRSCANWTYPSSVCALTGLDLVEEGFILQRTPDAEILAVPPEMTLFAEALRLREYDAGLVTANSFLGEFTHADRGHRISRSVGLQPAEVVVDQGLEVWDALQEGAPRPWFLHLHFMDPHMPYTPPEAYLEGLEGLPEAPYDLSDQPGYMEAMEDWDGLSEEEQALLQEIARVYYHGELRYLDDELVRLFDELDARGALDDTLVIVWSDHGEQFWERGEVAHGNAVYAEENAAIAGFWSRHLNPLAWTGPTSHEDLLPTALTALGFEPPDGVHGQVIGASEDDSRPPRFALSYSNVLDQTNQAVDLGGVRLLYHWSGRLELYDLHDDPAETADLYVPGHPDAATLWKLLEPRVRAVSATSEKPQPSWPDLTGE